MYELSSMHLIDCYKTIEFLKGQGCSSADATPRKQQNTISFPSGKGVKG